MSTPHPACPHCRELGDSLAHAYGALVNLSRVYHAAAWLSQVDIAYCAYHSPITMDLEVIAQEYDDDPALARRAMTVRNASLSLRCLRRDAWRELDQALKAAEGLF